MIPPLAIGKSRKKAVKIPKALSVGEETLQQQLTAYKIHFTREYQFCHGRKWRADFCVYPPHPDSVRILIECEGATEYGLSRHSRGKGIESDMRKYNEASVLGFTLLRFSTAMIKSGEAIDYIRKILNK